MFVDHQSILDQLDEHLVVIDSKGIIQYTNNTWKAFGQANGVRKDFSWIGINYLESCSIDHQIDGDIAKEALNGILSVIEGSVDHFHLNYPCHSPYVKRWFLMKVTPLKNLKDRLFLIRHINTTEKTVAEKLSLEDPLTHLFNRRYFDMFLEREWRRCLRNRGNLSLFYLDLDNFKETNDHLGHSAGDRSLIRFAKLLSEYTRRPGDAAVRLGGDEFTLVLADSTYAEADQTAQAISEELERMSIPASENTILTASIGFVNGIPSHDKDLQSWLDLADTLLYQAKSDGGNKVCGASIDASN